MTASDFALRIATDVYQDTLAVLLVRETSQIQKY